MGPHPGPATCALGLLAVGRSYLRLSLSFLICALRWRDMPGSSDGMLDYEHTLGRGTVCIVIERCKGGGSHSVLAT